MVFLSLRYKSGAFGLCAEHVEDRLTAQDDPGVWKEILVVLGEEFLQRYRAEADEKESWFLRILACSHWVRPHQSRWLAAGGFALAIG